MSATAKQIIFISILIVFVFLPSLFAELSTVDDIDMYKWLMGPTPSFKDVFFPQASGAAYFRPLIVVSYLFDKYVWFLDTRLMHLDNLIFHIANVLLIYFLASKLVNSVNQQRSMVPLLSSLIFGLHPITTESVAWISGRTDIMAFTFVLLSTVFLLRFRETGKILNLVISLLVLVPGLLFKETPLAFLMGALFILTARRETSVVSPPDSITSSGEGFRCAAFAGVSAMLLIVSYNVWPVFICGLAYLCLEAYRNISEGKTLQSKMVLVISLGLSVPMGMFFLIRKIVFISSIGSIGRTLKLIANDLNYSSQTFLGAAGFYVRKFFAPFPLNFAIREIDPIYNIVGVAVFFSCLYAIRRRSMNCALFLCGVCLFLPALPLSLGTVTWTAFAERYIYMSTAFWALMVCLWGGEIIETKGHRRIAMVCSSLLLLVMGVCTFQRSMLWRTNLGMLRDTVKKSPGFKTIRVDYMTELMGIGDLEAAKEQYKIAQTIPSVGYFEPLDINMAALFVMEGKFGDAEKMYNHVLDKTKGKSTLAYNAYIIFLWERFAAARQGKEGSVSEYGTKIVENMEKLFYLDQDPMLLYRSAQLSLALGKCDDALRLFDKAAKTFPEKNEYAQFSNRLATNLVSGNCRQEHL